MISLGRMTRAGAIAAIERAGVLLVFPVANRPEPASLWAHFHPGEPMEWEWDEDGDDRVARLWHLRAELSTTDAVVYTKWFRGRATYFSRGLFTAMLRALTSGRAPNSGMRSQQSRAALPVVPWQRCQASSGKCWAFNRHPFTSIAPARAGP